MQHDRDENSVDLAARIARLETKREIEELDADWARQRERLMDRDGEGRLRAPAGQAKWVGGGLAFLAAGALTAFWGETIGLGAVFVAIGLAILLFGLPHAATRRRLYQAQLAAYKTRREKLRDDVRSD